MKQKQLMSEEGLIQKVLGGDDSAVFRLYSQVSKNLKAYFSHKVQEKEDTDELIQDTFLHFLDALPLFRFQSSLSTFVMGIARHELMDYWRKKYAKRLIRTTTLTNYVLAVQYSPMETSEKIQEAMDKAYSKLKPLQAKLLKWKYEEGKSVKEIAALMGWTVKAAEAYLYRSRKAFQLVYVEPETY